ncbi:TPA: GNAT family N-acetyltransferase [Clostridium botulinum]|nr:GNAT family N-acetyltransferase [Clostridium botulinum]HCL4449592.1 GNAT family N-acetyltransferase [Clostridium botulinum]HCL4454091.1 GNAT family N-acetyltransferase [Clostridium botulinum]HCL4465090.1 GNAT family N-acetyltransferase [Clostridium botulinum]HCL4468781.1 GNAT family N-acetyltransferase [Clostridium botulinum]
MEESDLEKFKDMINDPELEFLAGGGSFPISNLSEKKWFEKIQGDTNNLYLAIDTEDEKTVGMATIINIDWKNRRAYHGIKLGKSTNRGKGIGTDTVMAVMRYAFDELQLNRLDGSIREGNKVSEKLYIDKCGWKEEGILRKYIFKRGRYYDLALIGVLKEEYYDIVDKLKYWK